MQFANETNETPLFAVKAVTGPRIDRASVRAMLSAALLQRPGLDGAILDGNRSLAGRGVSAASGPSAIQWMASRRLHDWAPPIGNRTDYSRSDAPPPPTKTRPASKRGRLEQRLGELARTLSDGDLALALAQMRLLARARRHGPL